MGIFFWDFSECNDTPREWAMFVVNFFVFSFVIRALLKTVLHYKRCIFQLVPLTVNLLAALILLLLKLFEKGYEFDEIGHLVQIFTYFLFCHTFALMYSKLLSARHGQSLKRIWNLVLLLFLIAIITFSIFIFSGFISNQCKNKQTEKLPTLISLGFEIISFVPTMFYGMRILNSLKQKQTESDNLNDSQIFLRSSQQQYIRQKNKQIKIILLTYFVSLVLRLILTILSLVFYDELFDCQKVENVYILSGTTQGQIILILAQINQLTPHVMIPIAMYVIPLKKYSSGIVHLSQELYIEDDSKEDYAQQKITQALSRKLSSIS